MNLLKKIIFTFFIIGLQFSMSAQTDSTVAFETFEYKSKDSTYIMKKYFLCLLYSGENRGHDEKTAADIQQAHLNHIADMAAAGKLAIAGPMGDKSDLRGVFIFNVPTLEEAQKLAASDPAVKAGRLRAEIHPWWAAVGSTLP